MLTKLPHIFKGEIWYGRFQAGIGAADKPILEAAIILLANDRMNEILVTGSIAETLAMLPSFLEGAKLPYVIYVDVDNGGREIKRRVTSAGIAEEKLVSLRDILNDDLYPAGTDFELEDIISNDVYERAVNEIYIDKPVEIARNGDAKRTRRYEEAYRDRYRIGFNKRRVAEQIKRIIINGGLDDDSKTKLKRIIDRLIGALDGENVQENNRY